VAKRLESVLRQSCWLMLETMFSTAQAESAPVTPHAPRPSPPSDAAAPAAVAVVVADAAAARPVSRRRSEMIVTCARKDAWRFDITSAAEMPLPETSPSANATSPGSTSTKS
jgi:hypothetical protein